MKKNNRDFIVALDIGTSKVVALVAEITPENDLRVVGLGSHPSQGLKKGVVVNIEATVKSIQKAVAEAELMADCQITKVYTGIAGSHIRSLNSHGIVAIRDNEVASADVERVLDAAKAVAIPADQKILHILPQEFLIDHQPGIREPIGMSGVRLEAKVHIVTGALSASQNIVKCVRRCGLEVADVILQPLASSHAVLSEDEKELGVCLIDIGGGTTDLAVFVDGAIRHTAIIPIAGDHVTNDIAVALRTPTQSAERIKLEYANLLKQPSSKSKLISVPGVGERGRQDFSELALTEVVSARYEELFYLILAELRRSGFEDRIASGLVFTGGASKVKGCKELADTIFQTPIRMGIPHGVTGMEEVIHNPIYATGIGLLLYAHQQRHERRPEMMLRDGMKGMLERMRQWLQGTW